MTSKADFGLPSLMAAFLKPGHGVTDFNHPPKHFVERSKTLGFPFIGKFYTKNPADQNPLTFCLDLFSIEDPDKRVSRTFFSYDPIKDTIRFKREEFSRGHEAPFIAPTSKTRLVKEHFFEFCRAVLHIRRELGFQIVCTLGTDLKNIEAFHLHVDLTAETFFPNKKSQFVLFDSEKDKLLKNQSGLFELEHPSAFSPFGLSLHFKLVHTLNDKNFRDGVPLPIRIIRYINGYCYQLGPKTLSSDEVEALRKYFKDQKIAALQTDFLGQHVPTLLNGMAEIEKQVPSIPSMEIARTLFEQWLNVFDHFLTTVSKTISLLLFNESQYPAFGTQLFDSLREMQCEATRKESIQTIIDHFGFLFSPGHWIDPYYSTHIEFLDLLSKKGRFDFHETPAVEINHLCTWDYKRPLALGVGVLRKILLALGDLFRNLGFFSENTDIFFFTYEELQSLFNVPEHLTDYKKAVAGVLVERKKSFRLWQTLSPPTFLPLPPISRHQSLLKGEIFLPGQIEGAAVNIRSSRDMENCIAHLKHPAILVTPCLPHTFAPLLHLFQGIVCESSALPDSCSQIIHKNNIPTVFQMPRATQVFVHGCGVKLQAHEGWAQKLDAATE